MTILSTFPSVALQSSALMHRLLTPSLLSATLNDDHQSHQSVAKITHNIFSTTSSISLLGSTQSTGVVSLAIDAKAAPKAPVPPLKKRRIEKPETYHLDM